MRTERIIEDVWKAAEDLIAVAEQLEENHAKADGEKLRAIVGRIENWCISFKERKEGK